MTNKEILEGNVLIAEFMGWKVVTGDKIKLPYKNHYFGINPITKRIYNSVNSEDYNECWTKVALYVKYNSSWDWLMPVVQKVTKLIQDKQYIPIGKYQEYKEQYDIYEEQWRKLFDYQAYNFFKADIESIYKAMISFIEWYNHNIKNT